MRLSGTDPDLRGQIRGTSDADDNSSTACSLSPEERKKKSKLLPLIVRQPACSGFASNNLLAVAVRLRTAPLPSARTMAVEEGARAKSNPGIRRTARDAEIEPATATAGRVCLPTGCYLSRTIKPPPTPKSPPSRACVARATASPCASSSPPAGIARDRARSGSDAARQAARVR